MQTDIFATIVQALLQRFRQIAAAVSIALVIGILTGLALPKAYTADSRILIVPGYTQVQFDERIEQLSRGETGRDLVSKETVVALSESTQTALVVLSNIVGKVDLPEVTPEDLLALVSTDIAGETLSIVVRHPDEQTAIIIAEAWAGALKDIITESFTGSNQRTQTLQQELDRAQNTYNQAQLAYTEFLKSNQIAELTQQRDNAVEIVTQAYESDRSLYTGYLAQSRQLDLLLNKATTLQEQIDQGTTTVVDAVSILLLQISTLGLDVNTLPLDIQLSDLTVLNDLSSESEETLSDIIQVLETRRADISQLAQELADSLSKREGTVYGLSTELRNEYNQINRDLSSQIEQLIVQRDILRTDRDLALESLNFVKRQTAAQGIANYNPPINIVYLGVSSSESSRLIAIVYAVVIAEILAMVIMLGGIIWLDVLRPNLQVIQQNTKKSLQKPTRP